MKNTYRRGEEWNKAHHQGTAHTRLRGCPPWAGAGAVNLVPSPTTPSAPICPPWACRFRP